eukprot:gene32545-39351_t
MNGLSLDLSMRQQDGMDALGATYRDEGLSVGANHMRLYGEEVEMEVSFNDLILGRRIGQGACSSVNLAQHRRTGETYAIKLFNIYDRGQASQLYNEILLLTSFSCDALISLKGAFHDSGSIGVILEFMDRGSLEFLMQPGITLGDGVLASVAYQMAWGLGYLHHEKQIHRDIKPGNALMNSQGQVKLSDFGISKELEHTTAMSNSAVGSYMYMSPERLVGDKYDSSADVWSLGVSIVQLHNKHYPFTKCAETPIHLCGELENFDVYGFSAHTIYNNSARAFTPPPYTSALKSFIRSTMARAPADRSTCLELIRDCVWFQTYKLDGLETAQEIVARWLRELDRQRLAPAPVTFQSPQSGQTNHAHQTSHRQVMDLSLRDRDAFEASLSMTWGNSHNAHSSGGMDMSMSFGGPGAGLKRPNPFTASMSGSFMMSNSTTAHGYQNHAHNASIGRGGGGLGRGIEEEVYDDDFEEEVEPYQVPAHYRGERKSESKSDGRKYKK